MMSFRTNQLPFMMRSHIQNYGHYVTMGGLVAQSVEQRTENPRVDGSIPSQATIKMKRSDERK